MRSSNEIEEYAKKQGLTTYTSYRGTSYRAGGDIIIYPDTLDWQHGAPCSITKKKNAAFDGTGFAGRGRYYDAWFITPPKEGMTRWVIAEKGSYEAVPEEKRMHIGRADEGRSGANPIFFIEEGSDKQEDLDDMFGNIADFFPDKC